MSKFVLREGFLEVEEPDIPNFDFEKARRFQNEAFNWYCNSKSEVSILESPVGSGKTSAFASIIDNMDENSLSVITYPTNSLMVQQKDVLQDWGLDVKVINSKSLDGSGIERVRNFNKFLSPPESFKYDCIITNPDVLESVIQGLFFDPSDKLMNFFDKIDFIVYDEFHFYDCFSSSGILLQSKVILERSGGAKVMFCSATPRKDSYRKILDRDFDIEVLDSSVSDSGSLFRHKTEIKKYSGSIMENKDSVCEKLRNLDMGGLFSNVLIFNSASDCNKFYNYLHDNYQDLYEISVKDNGYDTYSSDNIDFEGHILLTTSKGEVGLDYDVENLFMDAPWNSRKIIQRAGRCGRHSEGKIFVYGLSRASYDGSELDYNSFVDKMHEQIGQNNFNSKVLEELIGMRCANALVNRKFDSYQTNPNLYEDFSHKYSKKWKDFFYSIKEKNVIDSSGFITGKSKKEERVEDFLIGFINNINSLRGSNIQCNFRYRRGSEEEETIYSLIPALRSYYVEEICEDGTIILSDSEKDSEVLVQYRGLGMGNRKKVNERFSISEELSNVLESVTLKDNYNELLQTLLDIVPENHLRSPHTISINGEKYNVEDLEI